MGSCRHSPLAFVREKIFFLFSMLLLLLQCSNSILCVCCGSNKYLQPVKRKGIFPFSLQFRCASVKANKWFCEELFQFFHVFYFLSFFPSLYNCFINMYSFHRHKVGATILNNIQTRFYVKRSRSSKKHFHIHQAVILSTRFHVYIFVFETILYFILGRKICTRLYCNFLFLPHSFAELCHGHR